MAIRRELLRLGGVNFQAGVWLVPTADNHDQRLRRARYLVQRAEGRVLLATPLEGQSNSRCSGQGAWAAGAADEITGRRVNERAVDYEPKPTDAQSEPLPVES
jgi:hypothetical protein